MLKHKGTVPLHTERLLLRPYTPQDAEAMFKNWANDERVSRYLTWPPHGTLDVTKALLDEWCPHYSEPSYYNWTITLDDTPIGSVSVVHLSEKNEHCEIGYCLGYDYWQRGIMTEAVRAVIAFLFKEVGFNRVCILHAVKNPASGRVAQKCGLTYEGTAREYFKASWGEFLDIANYGITKAEWVKQNT